MLGSIIGGALQVGGSIFGGLKASQAMKEAKNRTERMQAQDNAWFNRAYNEDATQRADTQHLLTEIGNRLQSSNRATAARMAVSGGTEESAAAARASNNQALADTTAQIAASAASRKDAIQQQHTATQTSLNAELNQMDVNKANAIVQAANGAAETGKNIAGLI